MLFLLLFILGLCGLIATIVAKQTNNAKLLGYVIKKKPEENDEVFIARAYKNGLLLSAGFAVIGLIGYLF